MHGMWAGARLALAHIPCCGFLWCAREGNPGRSGRLLDGHAMAEEGSSTSGHGLDNLVTGLHGMWARATLVDVKHSSDDQG